MARRFQFALALVVTGCPVDDLGPGTDNAHPERDASSDSPPSTGQIQVRGDPSTASVRTDTSVTLPVPRDVQAGDVLMAIVHASAGVKSPGGWTQRADIDVDGFHVAWLTKTAQAEPPSYTFTAVDTKTWPIAGMMIAFVGVDPSVPFDATSSPITGAVGSLTGPSVTTSTPGDLLLLTVYEDNGAGATWTTPSGAAAIASIGTLALFDAPLPSAGPTPTLSTTPSNGGGPYSAVNVIALRRADPGH
jgi:hypothetical protein